MFVNLIQRWNFLALKVTSMKPSISWECSYEMWNGCEFYFSSPSIIFHFLFPWAFPQGKPTLNSLENLNEWKKYLIQNSSILFYLCQFKDYKWVPGHFVYRPWNLLYSNLFWNFLNLHLCAFFTVHWPWECIFRWQISFCACQCWNSLFPHRLEHVDEILRSARLSGYLYIRTVLTSSTSLALT